MKSEQPGQQELRAFITQRLGEARSERSQAEQDVKRAQDDLATAQERLKASTAKVSYLEQELADKQPAGAKAHHAPAHEAHKAKSA